MMLKRRGLAVATLTILAWCIATLFAPARLPAEDEPVRTPEEILAEAGEVPSPEAIRELFINCSAWDQDHEEVKEPSKQALIELGALAVPTLLEYLPSTNVLKRVTLDDVIRGIGHPAAEFLVPYLESEDDRTRRHAAYLLGDTAAIGELDDPTALGPLDEDRPAIDALRAVLEVETDWHVVSSIVGALGRMRDPGQIEVISGHLDDDEQAIRLSAVISLGRIPDQDAVAPLIRGFSDPLMNVRQAAVLALSTETMGNLAFEALLGRVGLPEGGMTGKVCALETLSRYLKTIGMDDSIRTNEQRKRAFDLVGELIQEDELSSWKVRGFAVTLLSYTYEEEAEVLLEELSESEEHPFVIGKIQEASEVLEAGRPAEEE